MTDAAQPETTPSSTSSETVNPPTSPGDAVAAFVAQVAHSGAELHSLTVLRSGQRLVEMAVTPWTMDGAALVYSMSKTFTSAAFGIAWDEGKLSPDDLLIDLFPDLVDDRVGPKARTITLGACLAMASGHTTDTITLFEGRWTLGPEGLGEFLRYEPEGEVGVRFCYNQLCTYAVSLAISKAMGQSVHDLIRERVLEPLGAGPTWWAPDTEGNTLGFSGLHIAPRDLASFIGLLAAGGVHEGRRLLPQRWIEEYSVRRVATTIDEFTPSEWAHGYGYQVWRSRDGHRADGAYGQYGLIWPERELAVVITSASLEMQPTIDAVHDLLLPALDDLQPVETQVPPAEGAGPSADQVIEATDDRGGRLQLTSIDGGWELIWDDADGGSHRLGVGHQHWVDGSMHWNHPTFGQRTAVVACSGAQSADGTIELRIACVQTPHTAVLSIRDDQAVLSWPTPPLGHSTIAGLSLPDGWR